MKRRSGMLEQVIERTYERLGGIVVSDEDFDFGLIDWDLEIESLLEHQYSLLRKGEYFIFLDESVSSDRRYLLIGLLCVPANALEDIRSLLRRGREDAGFFGEVHFSKVRGKYRQECKGRAGTCESWINALPQMRKSGASFTCLVADRHHSEYNKDWLVDSAREYNYLMAVDIKASIKYYLSCLDYDYLNVIIKYDSKNSKINRKIDKYILEKATPIKELMSEYEAFDISISPIDSKDEDCIQMVDLFTGGICRYLSCKLHDEKPCVGRHKKDELAIQLVEGFRDHLNIITFPVGIFLPLPSPRRRL